MAAAFAKFQRLEKQRELLEKRRLDLLRRDLSVEDLEAEEEELERQRQAVASGDAALDALAVEQPWEVNPSLLAEWFPDGMPQSVVGSGSGGG